MLGDGEEEFVEDGGGWRLYSRVWQTLHLGRGGAAVLRTRVSSARRGVGRVNHVFLFPADATCAHFCDALRAAAWARVRDGLFWTGARSHLFPALSALGETGGAA